MVVVVVAAAVVVVVLGAGGGGGGRCLESLVLFLEGSPNRHVATVQVNPHLTQKSRIPKP